MKAIIYCVILISLISCRKTSPSAMHYTSMNIVGIKIDSIYQVSNPISYLVNTTSNTNSYQTTLFQLPYSNGNVYPDGVWNNLNYRFNVQSTITLSVNFEFPASNQTFLAPYSTFTFVPATYISNSKDVPQTISLVSNAGPDETHITLTLNWK